jgi:Ca2+-binding EF-hand superfamily protein
MLTDLQKRKLTRFFNVWDADGDGVITKQDPEQVARNLARLQGLEPGSPRYAAFYNGFMLYQRDFIQAVDMDESGRVTLEEWLAYHDEMLQSQERFQGTALMAIQAMFQLMDRNEDGKISLEEYAEWMRTFGVEEQSITDNVFQKLDMNGDGTLSQEETLQLTREFFYSDDPDARGNWALGSF